MTNTYWYGNRKPVQHKNVQGYHASLEFSFHTVEESSEFAEHIDHGLCIRIQTEHGSQEITLNREDFNVIPSPWGRHHTLRLTNPRTAPYAECMTNGQFLHLTPSTAIGLAAELSRTILHMMITPVANRKQIHVYYKTPVAEFAHVILKSLGLGRIRQGLTRDEFYQEFTPDSAEDALKSVLSNCGVSIRFLPHDGKKRPLYCSLFGEGIIEFAEQSNGQA